tara:strand:- start:55 stop:465 length:411 start_codon:yes stop_codon:yes gene_type:complete
MRTALIAIAAGLMTLGTVSAQAATTDQTHGAQTRPGQSQPQRDNNNGHNNGHNTNGNDRHNTPDRNDRQPTRGEHRDNYGTWQSSWGARPSAPPAHFTRQSDWYRHVRACESRYRSYNPRTDRYVPRIGRTAVCRL